MKKTVVFAMLIAIFAAISAFAFAGCSASTPDEIADNYTDLAADGSFAASSGGKDDSAVFSFGKEISFNTLVLREKGSSITQFSLYADDAEEPFYSSDLIEDYRVCSFTPVTASSVRIAVDACDGEWSLKDAEAYLIDKKASDDFRIMGYITVDSLCNPVTVGDGDDSIGDQDGGIDESYTAVFEAVTQFNMIGSVYFDAQGKLYYKDISSYGDGSDNGEEAFGYALEKLRAMKADDAEIVVTILGNDAFVNDGYTDTIGRHNAAMGDNADALTANIIAFLDKWDLDGVSFDYEYPSFYGDFKTYGEYLLSLREALDAKYDGEMLLTAAISDWCMGTFKFSSKYMEALDQIEVMAYDLFDDRGYHSTFYRACYQIVENCRKNGADMSKVHLGVPYYSRPVDGGQFWGNYKVVSSTLPPSNLYTFDEPYTTLDGGTGNAANYFNDRQMIYDKTSYAIDLGLGGIMIWHMACDDTSDLGRSLTGAIAQAIADREALAQ